MGQTHIFTVVTIAIIHTIIVGILSSPSSAKDWQVRRQSGILKIVDLFTPTGSSLMNYAEGLVALDKDNNWVPCLAEDWRWIDDRTVEFALRPGVTFHNGEAFNAGSVRLNWEHFRKMESPRPIPFLNLPRAAVLETIDDYTVRFIFPEPEGFALPRFRWFFQFAPAFFTKHKFEEKNWGYLPEPGPWGTGPFRLVEGGEVFTKPHKRIVLKAYERYWNRQFPKVEEVVFENSLSGNRDEAMKLCRETEGVVDIVSFIRPLDTPRVVESRFAKVVKSKDLSCFAVHINQRKRNSRWRDIRLRKALNYAINRNELWKYAAKGNAYNLEGFLIPARAYGHNPNVTPFKYDANKARSLLKEAGFPNGFKMKAITAEAWRLESQIMSKMLRRIGLEVSVEIFSWPGYFRHMWIPALEKSPEDQTWDIAIATSPDVYGHSGLSILSWSILEESNMRWSEYDSEYESMWRDMATTVNTEAQEGEIRRIMEYAHSKIHNFVIYSPLTLYAVNNDVNFVPQGSIYLNLKETSVTENHWSRRGKNN